MPVVALANINDFSLEFLVDSVDEPTRIRSTTYKNIKRKKQFLLGRILLLKLYRARTNCKSPPNIDYSSYGQPGFTKENYFFSISHSKDLVACSFSENFRIGIDIEFIDPKREVNSIAKYLYSDKEKKWSNEQEKFYIVWTLKESLLKANGLGLDSFHKIIFDPNANSVFTPFKSTGKTFSYLLKDYIFSVAIIENIPIEIRSFFFLSL